ncbi:rhodanese-like domain-containing protein [Roseimicrobium sp. ORNL1]|uniref:rhodanese-like domain-containing protein n=1 Tax=Roseimicrobium sp. ORNL1 TaxID=2711231 RepID=UPI0013E11DAA|nr:rhodanese-like domain-containing protein [Roseimicrobium sp. ORNL1]QIF02452.1 rhodanese-like domain-containing protein [Roseimicrobium sp. ORNL1]
MTTNNSPRHSLFRDAITAAVIAAVAFAIGIGTNFLRAKPLPWVYEPPARAMVAAIQEATATDGSSQETSGSPSSSPTGVTGGVRIVSLQETRQMVEAGNVLILDARPDLFHQLGHIKGAKNLSKKNFQQDFQTLKGTLDAAHGKKRPILVYCADIHCPDAGTVAGWLMEKGYGGLLIFEGGWAEWESAGLAG